MSKFFTLISGLGLAGLGLALASEMMPLSPSMAPSAYSSSELPTALPADRFSALGKKSPFTLASTTEETVDFAKDLLLSGYFRMDGKDFIMVANRTRPDRIMVGTESSPAAQGLVLVKVERDPSGDPTKLKAKIRKGMETATLKYESAASHEGAVPPPVAGQPVPNPSPVPGSPQVIPPASGQAAPAPVIRRRVLPVPSPSGR